MSIIGPVFSATSPQHSSHKRRIPKGIGSCENPIALRQREHKTHPYSSAMGTYLDNRVPYPWICRQQKLLFQSERFRLEPLNFDVINRSVRIGDLEVYDYLADGNVIQLDLHGFLAYVVLDSAAPHQEVKLLRVLGFKLGMIDAPVVRSRFDRSHAFNAPYLWLFHERSKCVGESFRQSAPLFSVKYALLCPSAHLIP